MNSFFYVTDFGTLVRKGYAILTFYLTDRIGLDLGLVSTLVSYLTFSSNLFNSSYSFNLLRRFFSKLEITLFLDYL